MKIVTTAKRQPRSDQVRNRERLLAAAKDVLGTGGRQASLEAVAREAGVGIGTLYRHFPTREDLFLAVYRHEVELLIELAEGLLKKPDGLQSLRSWTHAYVDLAATKKGLLGALAVTVTDSSKAVFAELTARIRQSVDNLLAHAKSSGEIRTDIRADDFLNAVFALCYARELQSEWKQQVLHLLDIFIDGLRAQKKAQQPKR